MIKESDANANADAMLRELADQIERGELNATHCDIANDLDYITRPGDQYQRKALTGRSWLRLTLVDPQERKRYQDALAGE